jgi:hypothetical protein
MPHLDRHGEIVGHILALKTIPLIIYPTYAEYLDFSMGFMTPDLPWLSYYLPKIMTNPFDLSPSGFNLFFINMNFASTQLITSLIFLFILLLCYLGLSDPSEKQINLNHKQNYKFKASK